MTNIEAMKLALDAAEDNNVAAVIMTLRYAISDAEQKEWYKQLEVFFICDAYESGFGHGAKSDGLNDGSIFADLRHGEAYEIGYAKGLERSKRVAEQSDDFRDATKKAEQEPVAWANPHGGFLSDSYIKAYSTGLERETHTIPLYTAPPKADQFRGVTKMVDHIGEANEMVNPIAIIEKQTGFETEVYATGYAESLPDGVWKLFAESSKAEQEPVAWLSQGRCLSVLKEDAERWMANGGTATPLYTAPLQREWVSLTDDEIKKSWNRKREVFSFARAIEAKLKEKNK